MTAVPRPTDVGPRPTDRPRRPGRRRRRNRPAVDRRSSGRHVGRRRGSIAGHRRAAGHGRPGRYRRRRPGGGSRPGRRPWPGAASDSPSVPLAVAELARRLEANLDGFALLDALDTGSLVGPMRAGAGKGATQLRGNAGVAIELQGRTIPASATGWHLTKREPYGVVGAISAYNHPTLFACQRIGPPLVAGNTVVLKPSEQAPISAVALAALSADLLPPGVLNVVPGGAAVGAAIVGHPAVPRIAFTGSVSTGLAVQETAAAQPDDQARDVGARGQEPAAGPRRRRSNRGGRRGGQGDELHQGPGTELRIDVAAARPLVAARRRASRRSSGWSRAIRIGLPDDGDAEMGSLVSHDHRDRLVGVRRSVGRRGRHAADRRRTPADERLAAGALHDADRGRRRRPVDDHRPAGAVRARCSPCSSGTTSTRPWRWPTPSRTG